MSLGTLFLPGLCLHNSVLLNVVILSTHSAVLLNIVALGLAEIACSCTPQSSISISQRDLHFNHPATVVTVSFACPCRPSNVLLKCSSAWQQSYVDPSILQVLGDDSCLLKKGQTLMSDVQFVYLHSPPLDLRPYQAIFISVADQWDSKAQKII